MDKQKQNSIMTSKQSHGHLSYASDLYTVSQAVKYFASTLKKPNNYPRIVKAYLLYCLDKGYGIDDFSVSCYIAGKKSNQASPVRKFLRFAKQQGIRSVLPDPASYLLPPAANELILGFIRDATHLRGDRSKDTYVRALNVFFEYLHRTGQSFTQVSVGEYVNYLLKNQKSPFTVNLYLSVVKQLARWIVKSRERISHQFTTDQLESLRDVAHVRNVSLEPGYYKDALTEHEREHFISSIQEPRWQSACALMAYCGLRTVEVTRLRLQDLDLEKKIIMVRGKGKHGYTAVKLFSACLPAVEAWLQQRKRIKTGHDALFVDDKESPLSCDQLRYQVKKALKACGLNRKKLSTHSLRHTAAQLLIDKNVEAIYVQRQLRHSSLDTTQKYILKKLDEKFFEKLPDSV